MTAYRVVRHDFTAIQWEITEPLPQVFASAAAAALFAQSLQMGAADCRVQYVVEAVDDANPPA